MHCADCVVSFETIELCVTCRLCARAAICWLLTRLSSRYRCLPAKLPCLPTRARSLKLRAPRLFPAGPIAAEVATAKSVNVVLLGALATRLDFSEEVWEQVISQRVPQKTIEANMRAFRAGYEFAKKEA